MIQLQTMHHAGQTMQVDWSRAVSLAIPLDFNGPQPSHFDAPAATAAPLRLGSFIGSTIEGGSCNCSTIQMVPHCNGTHTESVGHIVDDKISIHDVVPRGPLVAWLQTVQPHSLAESRESSITMATSSDLVISRSLLEPATPNLDRFRPEALILRTLPNDSSKHTRVYGHGSLPPFFTSESIAWLIEKRIEHLLVDIPSIDRMWDDGMLAGHHAWWNVPPRSRKLSSHSRPHQTITEMIVVSSDIPDGPYLLNLQVAPFVSDAAPSRPLIAPLIVV